MDCGRDRVDAESWNRLHPEAKTPRKPWVTHQLEGRQGPAMVATDYVRAFPNQIREYVPMRYSVLGTDGYARSDTRANLRRHFEVDRFNVALMRRSRIRLGFDVTRLDPTTSPEARHPH